MKNIWRLDWSYYFCSNAKPHINNLLNNNTNISWRRNLEIKFLLPLYLKIGILILLHFTRVLSLGDSKSPQVSQILQIVLLILTVLRSVWSRIFDIFTGYCIQSFFDFFSYYLNPWILISIQTFMSTSAPTLCFSLNIDIIYVISWVQVIIIIIITH